MTRSSTFTRGLLGATALTLFAAPAFAQYTAPPAANGTNDFTAAGEVVENTFTVTYTTGTATETITPPTSTDFTVDRLVNVTVQGSDRTGILPGATDQTVQFAVTNLGNDTQGYILDIEQETESPAASGFDTTNATSGTNISYYVAPADGICDEDPTSATAYTAGSSVPAAGIAPNAVLCVVVTQDIPSTADDTDFADVSLIASTTMPGSTTEVTGTADNTIAGTENFLADTAGTFTGDAANDGDHSAISTYTVGAADVSALKSVVVLENPGESPSNCATAATAIAVEDVTKYAAPGACVEYVIEVTNSGSQDATSVDIGDILPPEVTYASAAALNFSNTPTVATASASCVDGSGTPLVPAQTCTQVTLSGGTVPANDGTNDGVSQLVIRATVN